VILVVLAAVAALPSRAMQRPGVYSSVDEENAKKILTGSQSHRVKYQMVFSPRACAEPHRGGEGEPQADVWFGPQ